jgi:hypothetical protein
MQCLKFPNCRCGVYDDCRECVKKVRSKPFRNLSDEEINLIIETEFKVGMLKPEQAIGRVEDLRILRAMDKEAAKPKLKTRYQLLKEGT